MRGGYFELSDASVDQINAIYIPTRGDTDVDEDEARDRPFNAQRFAASDEAREIVAEAITLALNCEDHFKLRKSRRRAKDRAIFDLTVDALLSDLMQHHTLEYPKGIYVRRSNKVLGIKSRYRPAAYGKQFPKILDLLARPELDYVRQEIAPATEGYGKSTVIMPGGQLLRRMEQHGIDETHLDEHPHSETILLKRTKDEDNFWDEGGLEEYEDTELTHRYRAELEDINRWLAAADLRFDHAAVHTPVEPFDIRARRLRRIFTRGRFDSGGRLFGGFWQALRKAERRQGLWISGEKAVELDYGQAGARILYGMTGHTPPGGDLYAFPGYYQQRAGIKRVMSAITFATSRPTSFPKGTRDLFRRRDKIGEVLTEIERHHPLIRDMLYRGFGHEVQFTESQIIIEVVQTLKAEGVVALPIHDAIMIPTSAVSRAKEVMLDVFHRRSDVEGSVTEERE